MTRHGFMLMALAIMAIASWAYSINYNTMTTLDRISRLRSEIAAEREKIQVLTVEWAFLNAPDRLRRLVDEYQEELALMPIAPDAMQHVAVVPFPEPELEEDPVIARAMGGSPLPAVRPISWRPQ